MQVTTGPEEIAEGFTSLIERPEAVMALVRRDGSVLARLPPFSSPLPAIGAGSEFHRTVEDGFARRVYVTTSVATGEPTLYAQRRAGEYPVHAIVGRRVSTIHAAWAWRFLGLLAWAAPAMLCLVWAALHARRRAIETEQAEAARRAESARRAIAEAREAAEARFRTVFESDAMGMAIFEPATAATFAINDRLLAMQGLTRAAFTAGAGGWGHATAPDCREADARARAQAIARGTWDPFEKDYLRPDGSRLPVRLFAAPLPREPGLVVVLVEDISRQRAAEARRELLLREIAHRARNTFALLRSLVRLSRAPTAAALAEALDGRIQALARSTALLTRDAGDGAAIEALLRTSLAPFLRGVDEDGREDPRVTLTGPVLMLDPSVAQPLAMVLHELATNAAKYGALSWPKGSLAIAWERRPDAKDTLVLRWSETGAPAPLTPPTGDGFGSELLDAIVTGQLGGQVSREWRAEGLVSTLTVPLRPEG